MKKNRKNLFSPRFAAVMGLCAAMTVVLDKFLIVPVGSLIRFGLGAMPVLLVSLCMSPVAAAVIALVSDIIGCLLVGYEINPIVTLGFVLTAFLSGFIYRLGFFGIKEFPKLIISVFSASFVGSLLVTSFGLWLWYAKNSPYILYVGMRVPSYIVNYSAVTLLLGLIKSNKSIKAFFDKVNGEKND